MEKVLKNENKEVLVLDINVSLANAIRRSVNEIKNLAIKEVEIYNNDSSFTNEMLAHRIGLIPIKNEKIKEGDIITMKLKVIADQDNFEVLSKNLGNSVAIENIPIIRLNKNQKIELIAQSSLGTGKEHARHIPGLIYYYNLNKINIKTGGRKNMELAEKYPKIFKFDEELKVENEWACNFDNEDLNVPNIEISPTDKIVFLIESWGGMSCGEIISESTKVLSKNLEEVKKALK
jgi:DNA-directed RNA polymerase subunit D